MVTRCAPAPLRTWLASIALAIGAAATPVAAAAPDQRFIALGAPADAPGGFDEMCDREPEACGGAAPRPAALPICDPVAAIRWTRPIETMDFHAALKAEGCTPPAPGLETAAIASAAGGREPTAEPARDLLATVNKRVNRAVRQQTDLATFGTSEWWQRSGTAPGAVGDCEDIALEKRAALLAAGYDPERLFLAVVFRRGVGLHTVLVARTAAGDMVLDSLGARIVPWHKADFSWLRVQAPGNARRWHALG